MALALQFQPQFCLVNVECLVLSLLTRANQQCPRMLYLPMTMNQRGVVVVALININEWRNHQPECSMQFLCRLLFPNFLYRDRIP